MAGFCSCKTGIHYIPVNNGFADNCIGAGPCIKTITQADADQNQVVSIESHFEEETPPQSASYTYNYLNQRVSKTVAGVTTYFIYDEQGQLLSEIDASGNSLKDYIYMDGEPVAHVEKTGDTADGETLEQVFYPINDHLGQPIMAMRADMKISHEQYSNPFGQMYARYIDKSIGVDGVGPTEQNRRFPGQYYDQETGYSQNHYRTYDSSTGNYLQADPRGVLLDFSDPQRQATAMMGIKIPKHKRIGYLNHSYNYADNNPVMNTDPTGENPVAAAEGAWALGAALGAAAYASSPALQQALADAADAIGDALGGDDASDGTDSGGDGGDDCGCWKILEQRTSWYQGDTIYYQYLKCLEECKECKK